MTITPYYERDGITLYVGDNRDVLPHLENISAVITDPPYGLSFMGKDWDHEVPGVAFWEAMREAMLPGAHLLSFGGTRTFHRIAVAIEDAGFEIRDTLMWLYGSGFPKSHDVSKAIESRITNGKSNSRSLRATEQAGDGEPYTLRGKNNGIMGETRDFQRKTFTPATPEAAQWQGWGTALKPSFEPVICARKPLAGTVAANVLQHGTGALNIDACRIVVSPNDPNRRDNPSVDHSADHATWNLHKTQRNPTLQSGRWPANVILDEAAAAALDAQSGERPGCKSPSSATPTSKFRPNQGSYQPQGPIYGDTGGASRFFYVAKASRKERNAGLDGMPERDTASVYENGNGLSGRSLVNGEWVNTGNPRKPKANHHPTVKPLALMRYLVTLITPPGGIVLDPFAGSGSTLVACAELGFPAIGIELSEEYCEIIARRVDHALNERPAVVQPSLLEMVAD